jgi:CSLREA domain-containing protein
MLRSCGLIGIAAALSLALPAGAGAATITPTPGFFADNFANDDNCSLREAIEVANDDSTNGNEDSCGISGGLGSPDTVQLEAGTYTLDIPGTAANTQGDLNVANDALTLIGAGAGQTTIAGAPGFAHRIIQYLGHTNPEIDFLTIQDLTITGGDAGTGSGGGVQVAGDANALFLHRARVTGNTALFGGGVNHSAGELSVTESEISNNTAGTRAGLDSVAHGRVTITRSVVRENTASSATGGFGAGLVLDAADTTITDSVIAGNKAIDSSAPFTASSAGAFLSLSGDEQLTIRNSTISGNRVEDVAGALAGSGGGLALSVISGTATARIVNSTISGNGALSGGGVEKTGIGLVTFIQTTFGPNDASNQGTAIRVGGVANFERSVVDDAAGGPTACFEASGGTSASDGGNVAIDESCELTAGGDVQGTDPQLGALQGNGGPQVGAPDGPEQLLTHDLSLASPAIDRVPDTDCLDVPDGSLSVDQRGLARPVDGDLDGVGACDSGSIELQVDPPGSGSPPPAAQTPAPTAGDDPACDALRRKLKSTKSKKAKRKLRKKLRRRDC